MSVVAESVFVVVLAATLVPEQRVAMEALLKVAVAEWGAVWALGVALKAVNHVSCAAGSEQPRPSNLACRPG